MSKQINYFAIFVSIVLVQSADILAQNDATEAAAASNAKVDPPAEVATNSDAVTVPAPTSTAAITDSTLNLADIESRRNALSDATGISEPIRQQLVELYGKAVERINDTTQAAVKHDAYRAEQSSAADELAKLEAGEKKSIEPLIRTAEQWNGESLEIIRQQLGAADTELEQQKATLGKITGEIDRRTARLREIPELTSHSRSQLADAERLMTQPAALGEAAELVFAKHAVLVARKQFRQREIEMLQQEAKTYEATSRLLSLRRDLADRATKLLQRKAEQLRKALSIAEKLEAERQASAARRAVATAHPAVREAAKINTELAEANRLIVTELESTRQDLQSAETKREGLTQEFEDTRKRAEAAEFSEAVGLMLRGQQGELTGTKVYRERSRQRRKALASLNLKLLEWETSRRKIVDVSAFVDDELESLGSDLQSRELEDVQEELKQICTSRLQLYTELVSNAKTQLSRLASLGAAERDLADVIDAHAAFIAERVLWVRSTTSLDLGMLAIVPESLKKLFSSSQWTQLSRDMYVDFSENPLAAAVFIAPVWLLMLRRKLKSQLEQLGREAIKANVVTLMGTWRATLCTCMLAIPIPIFLGCIAWRLTSFSPIGSFGYTVGHSLTATTALYLFYESVKQICRRSGLGSCHFGWHDDAVAAIRKAMTFLQLVCLLPLAVCLFTEIFADELIIGSVGRLALIIGLLLYSLTFVRLLRSTGSLSRVIASVPDSWLTKTYRIWASVLILGPMFLAVASLVGYHYTASRLTLRLAITLGGVALLFCLRAFATRWLLLSYRRLAIKRSRERREALFQAREAQQGDGGDLPAIEPLPELRLSDINEQARRLIRLAVVLLGLGLTTVVWHEVLPAFGIVQRIELWDSTLASAGHNEAVRRVTLGDLCLGVCWVTLTVYSCRNLPGLIDMTVLHRLPMDAGARYAAGAMTRYATVVIGAIFSFRQIGVGWGSVQWLVAAMTVGLGFGLQEIFANFVSGVILLFERPVRIGDTVTIGEITGTVTRIRIRATTILDWDNKELIVPNRDFVTGNLVNWTLSNPNLRLVVKIGVAYGSNTELVTALLHRIARDERAVLDDPEPVVVFSGFGESSLDFELRLFVSGLSTYRLLKHDLHMAIDREFRQHSIEIAFPQRDLHIRSLSPAVLRQMQDTQRDLSSQAVRAA